MMSPREQLIAVARMCAQEGIDPLATLRDYDESRKPKTDKAGVYWADGSKPEPEPESDYGVKEDYTNLLRKAEAIIYGQRETDYGTPKESFGNIAQLWTVLLHTPVGELDVINCMIALKLARAMQGWHEDSYLDIAGYAGCAERVMQ